ncbi:hypothetical protein SPSYN_02075 [Sporotomaculum syntrophicum]|uniref:Uncharacterized protein n=1 Tax=Sporotomaculum syntrophicum TaxID=182264 RepID=A0A9D3AY14_9FIRM|nr:hypothetical protein [Sporotomaculum syntrophicum]KAF1084299.1 hypothetical protein SPSYN_02075 [Sporotomaculum syntrophicum]
MYKNILTKKFFKDNLVKDLTVQQFVYAQIETPELSQIASDLVRRFDNRADEERERLLRESDPDILLKMLRGKSDPINHHIVFQKVLEQEEVIIPRILGMLKTSLNVVFIENAVKILANTGKDYLEDLLKILDEIRSPYALSLTCITLGFIADEDAIPVLLKKYNELKNLYPGETYEQGPLYGLIKLNERFYN